MKVVKFSTCLPETIYLKLVETIRRPYGLPLGKGKLEPGELAAWLRNCAIETILKGKISSLSFIAEKGLEEEYNNYMKNKFLEETIDISNLL